MEGITKTSKPKPEKAGIMNKEKPKAKIKKVVKKTTKKVTKKKVVKLATKAAAKSKVTKKVAKKVAKKVVKKSNAINKNTTVDKIFLQKQRPKELLSSYNYNDNTYNGVSIIWANIQQFQIFFLEAQYKLTESLFDMSNFEKKTFESIKERASELKAIQLRKLKAIEELEQTYKIVFAIRRQVYNLYKQSDVSRAEIDKQCKNDPILWINTFAWTNDSRLTNIGLPAKLPFVLYPGQVDIINQVDYCYRNKKSFIIEKSRAEGLTEMLCAYDVWRFLYTPGYKAGWGSRVKNLVDQRDNEDTIFQKLRRIIYACPREMRPTGWKSKINNKHDNSMRLINPDNGASIIGEGGASIGRGGRSSFYKVDEAAFLAYPEAADSALRANTDCQGDISTPNGTNHFYRKKMSGRVTVITVWWWRNPSKNLKWAEGKKPKYSAWYERERAESDPVVLAQEVDIDYNASVGGTMIPSEWVNAAIDLDLVSDNNRVAGYDLAAGGTDKATYALREGVTVLSLEEIYATTPLEGTWIAVDKCERDAVNMLVYDRNTLGEDVYPQIKLSDRKVTFQLEGIYGQGSPSETFIESEGIRASEKFRNRRGELWWNLRKRFEKTYLHVNKKQFFPTNELISIPHHPELISELSSPLMVTTTQGKKGVESKVAMKVRRVQSPNWADSVAYAFAGSEESAQVVGTFNYSEDDIVTEIAYNPAAANSVYISAFLTEDQRLYVLITSFDLNSQRLDIVAEEVFEYVEPEEVAAFAESVLTKAGMFSMKDWYGNDRMFDGLAAGKMTIWYN